MRCVPVPTQVATFLRLRLCDHSFFHGTPCHGCVNRVLEQVTPSAGQYRCSSTDVAGQDLKGKQGSEPSVEDAILWPADRNREVHGRTRSVTQTNHEGVQVKGISKASDAKRSFARARWGAASKNLQKHKRGQRRRRARAAWAEQQQRCSRTSSLSCPHPPTPPCKWTGHVHKHQGLI